MAKLSARGRTEIYRLERVTPEPNRTATAVINHRERLALMSDRVILWHGGYGWKRQGKLKEGVTPEAWLEHALTRGWQRIS